MKQLCIVKLAITLAIVLLATQSALAQTTQRALLGSASFAALAFSTDRTSIKSLDQLRAKTSTGVPLRIIIGLRVPFAPEGQLSATNSTRQRAEIISARANLLSKVPTVRRKVDKIKNFDHIPFIAMEVDAVELEQLANLAEVTSIQEDRLMSTNLAQSVPMVGGTSAWASGYTGAGRTVAVLDTGVDKTHPFLTGKVVSEACYSTTNSSYASTSICPGAFLRLQQPAQPCPMHQAFVQPGNVTTALTWQALWRATMAACTEWPKARI